MKIDCKNCIHWAWFTEPEGKTKNNGMHYCRRFSIYTAKDRAFAKRHFKCNIRTPQDNEGKSLH
jgi:hypothetical protein